MTIEIASTPAGTALVTCPQVFGDSVAEFRVRDIPGTSRRALERRTADGWAYVGPALKPSAEVSARLWCATERDRLVGLPPRSKAERLARKATLVAKRAVHPPSPERLAREAEQAERRAAQALDAQRREEERAVRVAAAEEVAAARAQAEEAAAERARLAEEPRETPAEMIAREIVRLERRGVFPSEMDGPWAQLRELAGSFRAARRLVNEARRAQ